MWDSFFSYSSEEHALIGAHLEAGELVLTISAFWTCAVFGLSWVFL